MDSVNDTTPTLTPAAVIDAIPFLYLNLGSLLIGCVLVGTLFGITSVQTYIYYNGTSHRDRRFLKHTIFLLWALDAVTLILCIHAVYHYTVAGFTNVLGLLRIIWSASVYLIVSGISDFIVTGILAYRIWKLSGNRWPLLIILPFSVLTFIGLTVVGVLSLIFNTFQESQEKITWLWDLTYTLQAVTDIAIMLSMCVLLLSRRTGLNRSNTLINTLIFYSINTCILTGSVSVANVLAHALSPDTLIWLVLTALLPKLMLNSLLALLNSRDTMRNKIEAEPAVSVHISRLDLASSSRSSGGQTENSNFTVEVRSDYEAGNSTTTIDKVEYESA